MKKIDISKYKLKKGIGQIIFDVALSGGMYYTGFRFDGKGMIAYQTVKGIAYLAWDLIVFNETIDEDKLTEDK